MTLPIQRRRYPARRRSPLAGLPGFDNLFEQMNRMLTSAFPDVARISINSWSPPVDIQEIEDAYLIEADMPGVRPEDVSVDLQGKELHIVGEYGTAQQQEDEGSDQQGSDQQGSDQPISRRTGRFDYRLTLPGEVTSESCTADLEHGVLRLRLPKVAHGGRQRIPVQAGRTAQLDSGESAETGDTSSQANSATSADATSTAKQ
ncbi:MAG: Hsp20/alpha crystallin family protein [Actinomycetota bacterium]|nr:Hsp20/alpha crystallin family protein [Actinomycetota bacterium]